MKDDFRLFFGLKSPLYTFFFSIYLLIKMLFYKDLEIVLVLYCRRFVAAFDMSSTCYDVILFVVLLRHIIFFVLFDMVRYLCGDNLDIL